MNDQAHNPQSLVDYFSKKKLKVIDAAFSSNSSMVLCDDGSIYGFIRHSDWGQCGFGDESPSADFRFRWKKVKFFEDEYIKIVQIVCGSKQTLFVAIVVMFIQVAAILEDN